MEQASFFNDRLATAPGILLVREPALESLRGELPSAAVFKASLGVKQKYKLSTQKRLFFCSFIVETPSSYDQTASIAACMLISLAAARLAATSSISFSSSIVVFESSFQQSPPVFVTPERTQICYSIVRPSENAVDWSAARRMSETSDLKSQRSLRVARLLILSLEFICFPHLVSNYTSR